MGSAVGLARAGEGRFRGGNSEPLLSIVTGPSPIVWPLIRGAQGRPVGGF